MSIPRLVITFHGSLFKSQRLLVLENLAHRQQITTLRQTVKRCSSWNESSTQPDALDEPVARYLSQHPAEHSRRRVRQVRRVHLEFLTLGYPPFGHTPISSGWSG